jgi:hypothetical protein
MRLTKPRIASSPEPPQPTFGADDLASALASLATEAQASDGLTSVEWVLTTGWPECKVNKTLRELHRAKRLRVGRSRREAIDGSMRWVATYAIAPK